MLPRISLAAGPLLVAVVCLVAVPEEAEARAPSKRARRFEKKGKRAYKLKRWDDAVAAFKLAYEADPVPRFLFNAGRALEKKGDLVQAIEYVRLYLEEEEDPAEREDGEAELEILEQRLRTSHALVDFACEPRGARIVATGGGREVALKSPGSAWLEAGAWKVRVSADGHRDLVRELVLEPGAPVSIDDRLEPSGGRASDAGGPAEPEPEGGDGWGEEDGGRPPPPTPSPPPPVSASADATLGPLLLLAGSGVLLGSGLGFGLWADSARDDREGLQGRTVPWEEVLARQEEAESRALIANVLYAAGGVALATGAALLLTADGGPAAARALRVLPAGPGLVVAGTL